jgi:hypothetical protein
LCAEYNCKARRWDLKDGIRLSFHNGISKSMKHTYRIFLHYNILHINRIV